MIDPDDIDPDDAYRRDQAFNNNRDGGQTTSGVDGKMTIKTVMRASLSIASLSLGLLAVVTIAIGLGSKCRDPLTGKRASKLGPLAVSMFVGAGAFGTWRIRQTLLNGVSIIDTFPAFYSGNDAGHSAEPQKPPGLVEWENWIGVWLLCFVAIVVGGVYALDTYAIMPLNRTCEKTTNDTGLLSGLVRIRSMVYFLLAAVTIAPLGLALVQRNKLNADFMKAKEAYEREINPQKFATAMPGGMPGGNQSPEDLQKTLTTLVPSIGGYTIDGSTALYNASYRVAELVGYSGQRGQRPNMSTGDASAVSSDDMAALGG